MQQSHSHQPHPHKANDKALPSSLLIALFSFWILATIIGLWWFQQDRLKPFIDSHDDMRFFQLQSIDPLLQPYLTLGEVSDNQRTLLHFWRPDCLCNRISQRHFNRLIQKFSAQELRIIIIAHPRSDEQALQELKRLNGDRFIVVRAKDELLDLPSSPALAIYDEKGQINYFGPYGFGAFCTVREDGFLASIIEDESPNQFSNVIGDGCFCPWKD
jgi:hypothetical protein